jgi:ribosome assembly protein YihI (activator of Der GTPase)
MSITLEPPPVASTSAVTLDLDALTTPASLRQALRDLQTKESVLDDTLSALVSDRQRIDALLDRIDALAPLVGVTHTDAHDLAARVDATANVAERISGKVRILDLEQVSAPCCLPD